MAEVSLWQRFAHDPRSPQHAGLRAAHADREIVLEMLSAAFADGRLDADEFEERADATHDARTLGDLPPLLADLAPDLAPVAQTSSASATPDAVQRRAVEKWEAQRREALFGFLVPSLICWAIWAAVMFGGFPWPIFVMLGTGLNLVGTQVRRNDIIASEVRRLERRAAKERAKLLKQKEQAGHPEIEAGQSTASGQSEESD